MELPHSYLRFKMPDIPTASKVGSSSFWNVIAKNLTRIIPEGNPHLNGQLELVNEWVVKFDGEGLPVREVAIDSNDIAIAKLPWQDDYGYWTDNNLVKSDFIEQFQVLEIEKQVFLNYWDAIQ